MTNQKSKQFYNVHKIVTLCTLSELTQILPHMESADDHFHWQINEKMSIAYRQ